MIPDRSRRAESSRRRARPSRDEGVDGMTETAEQVLRAGAPLETPRFGVGHASTLLVDAARADRLIGVDCWYPATPGQEAPATYTVIPGVGFTASARTGATPLVGPRPLIVLSHG